MLGPARRGFIARFEREVDPERILPPEERTRRAERARRAYMLELAELSAKSRRAKKKATPAGRSAGAAKEDADVDGDPRQAA